MAGKIWSLLVVDDESSVLNLLSRSLSSKSIRVVTAQSGREAAAALGQEHFDVLLTDIDMETPTSGLDLAREAHKAHPELDIIIITGVATLDATVNALKTGAADIIPKPLDLFMVKFAVRRCLERRNLHARIELCVRAALAASAELQALYPRLAGLGGEQARECVAAVERAVRSLESLRKLEAPHKLEL